MVMDTKKANVIPFRRQLWGPALCGSFYLRTGSRPCTFSILESDSALKNEFSVLLMARKSDELPLMIHWLN